MNGPDPTSFLPDQLFDRSHLRPPSVLGRRWSSPWRASSPRPDRQRGSKRTHGAALIWIKPTALRCPALCEIDRKERPMAANAEDARLRAGRITFSSSDTSPPRRRGGVLKRSRKSDALAARRRSRMLDGSLLRWRGGAWVERRLVRSLRGPRVRVSPGRLHSSHSGAGPSIGTENPVPERIDHCEIGVRVPVMNEMQLPLASEPCKALKPRPLDMVFLVEEDVRVE